MEVDASAGTFDNVLVYVADALRFDAVPDALAAAATPVKTAASGLSTPECFSTILTGRYPPQHGVYRFSNQIGDDVPTLFDAFEHGVFRSGPGGGVTETLNLGHLSTSDLSEVPEPFCYLVRDTYTHTPYGVNVDDAEPPFDSSRSYWADRKGDREQVREDYERGVRRTEERFREFLAVLEERGIREETLVLFMGDHGELLGEGGIVAHGSPTCPELVYVPTLFVNDGVEPDGEFMGQVDLFPTVASLVGSESAVPDGLPGYDLTEGAPEDRLVFNQVEQPHFRETSVWDRGGGHVFREDGHVDRLRWFSRHMRGRVTRPYNRRHPLATLRTFLRGDRTAGEPEASRERAAAYREEVLSGAIESVSRELDEQVVERLEQLGYKEEI
jgi:arylsulfatase A-like enzyme